MGERAEEPRWPLAETPSQAPEGAADAPRVAPAETPSSPRGRLPM